MNDLKAYIYNWRYYLEAGALLMAGCLIYLLYRPKSIFLFDIIENLGLMQETDRIRDNVNNAFLPSIVVNSFPAGLWTASYLIMMYASTKYQTKKIRLMLSLPLPISAIVLEFFQLFSWCPGTFDIYDLICYIIPLLIFLKTI